MQAGYALATLAQSAGRGARRYSVQWERGLAGPPVIAGVPTAGIWTTTEIKSLKEMVDAPGLEPGTR